MFVHDNCGAWYEVADEHLKGKQVDPERVREITIATRAEKRKKIAELLTGLDEVDLDILTWELAARSNFPWQGIKQQCSGGCPECHCPECGCPKGSDPDWSVNPYAAQWRYRGTWR